MQEFMPQAMEFARNHTLMVLAWVGVFVMVVYHFVTRAFSKVKEINNVELTRLINNDNAVVVDIRSADDFARGHIIGSVHVLPNEIKTQNIARIEQHKNDPVVLVCATGVTASNIASQLVKFGFQQVYTLKEGLAGWHSANLPLVKR